MTARLNAADRRRVDHHVKRVQAQIVDDIGHIVDTAVDGFFGLSPELRFAALRQLLNVLGNHIQHSVHVALLDPTKEEP